MTSKISLDRQILNSTLGVNNATERIENISSITDGAVGAIIDAPRQGIHRHRLLTWRTPNYGYVKMYINPQSIDIRDKKIFTYARTKAGFVYQYAGEDLTSIQLSGTTGSSGMEGINVLHAVYRAEQAAFNGIADSLQQRATTAQMISLYRGATSQNFFSPLGQGISDFLSTTTEEFSVNMFEQPFPTLASLAANVELFFQGILYRGFFESFSFNERADTAGQFEYDISFLAYARQGVRRNFMPWHRQPQHPARDSKNPLSFPTSVESSPTAPQENTTPFSDGTKEKLSQTLRYSVGNNVPRTTTPLPGLSSSGVNADPNVVFTSGTTGNGNVTNANQPNITTTTTLNDMTTADQLKRSINRDVNIGAAGGNSLLSDLDLNDF